MTEQPPPLPRDKGTVIAGMGMGCAGNLVLLAIAFMIGSASEKPGLYFLAGIGLWQLIFVVPLCVRFQRRGASSTMAGLIIVAALSLLFCASCGALLLSFSTGSFR